MSGLGEGPGGVEWATQLFPIGSPASCTATDRVDLPHLARQSSGSWGARSSSQALQLALRCTVPRDSRAV